MAESIQLAAKKREGRGTRQARHLRKEGLVPAVVNGHKEQTVSLTLTVWWTSRPTAPSRRP